MYDFYRKKAIFNNKNFLYLIFDIVLISIGIALLIHRSLYGIDFTDQSWYVAEPYLVSKGAVPYADNWSQVPGFTIPLAFLTKIYTMFQGDTEGIFLFSRIEYIIWLVIVIISTFLFYNKHKDKDKIPFITLLPFLFITPGQCFAINYNTIGLIYLWPACIIFFNDFTTSQVRQKFISGVVSGIIIARAVIGTPYIILPCVILFFYLCYKKEWKKLQGYILGGFITATLVIGWICFRVGCFKFINGLQYWLNDSAYFKIESDLFTKTNFVEIFSYLKIFILCSIIAYISKRLLKTDKVYEKFLYILLLVFLLLGTLQYLFTNNFKVLTYWGWFEPIVLHLFLPKSARRKQISLFAFINILYSLVFVFSSFGNVYGFGTREYWLYIPLILSVVSVFSRNMESIQVKVSFRAAVIILSLLMIKLSFCFVYRDEAINNLAARIESGVWKGLYTTRERALAVTELEDYVKEITEKDDNVLFMDWSSFGYLMSNGKACTSSAYDAMQYSYDVNNPEIMYDYFNLTDSVPTKIIYIDFGRDEILSIEDEHWGFNQFVDYNYKLQSETELKMFRILLYELKNEEKAMEMSKRFMF